MEKQQTGYCVQVKYRLDIKRRKNKMKRLFLLIVLLNIAFANPVMIPEGQINEFMFDQNGNWWLEIILVADPSDYSEKYDSILVASSSGISKINSIIKDNQAIIVVSVDSLDYPVQINQNGDCVKVLTYARDFESVSVDSVVFGDYSNSMFPTLQIGYSITNIGGFCKDKTPTIGFYNDTSGVCGTMRGFLYDKNGLPVTEGSYQLVREIPIVPDSNGYYQARVINGHSIYKNLWKVIQPGNLHSIRIDTLEYTIEIDSIIYRDIYLQQDYTGIDKKSEILRNYKIEVKNYPNPFNNQTTFEISVPTDVTLKNAFIYIYNISGQRIKSIPLGLSYYAQWDGSNDFSMIQSAGIYFYKLVADAQYYTSGSILFLK